MAEAAAEIGQILPPDVMMVRSTGWMEWSPWDYCGGKIHSKRHFRDGDGGEAHAFVQVAKVADAEDLAHQRPKPAAQR